MSLQSVVAVTFELIAAVTEASVGPNPLTKLIVDHLALWVSLIASPAKTRVWISGTIEGSMNSMNEGVRDA
jgi:hypothetical protein